MHNHENEPRRESNRVLLAHVKKEMDEPRMSASAREEERANQTTRRELEICHYVDGCSRRRRIMAKLTTATRDRITAEKFAFPKQRKEPLENASHVRNASARFNQVEGVTEAERRAAWKRIQSAAKRFGVKLNEAA
jgi:hypothetical protein